MATSCHYSDAHFSSLRHSSDASVYLLFFLSRFFFLYLNTRPLAQFLFLPLLCTLTARTSFIIFYNINLVHEYTKIRSAYTHTYSKLLFIPPKLQLTLVSSSKPPPHRLALLFVIDDVGNHLKAEPTSFRICHTIIIYIIYIIISARPT